MGVGKYSPILPNVKEDYTFFRFNAYGKEPEPWTKEVEASGVVFDEKTMLANYDPEGYDSYGYSAFDVNGDYVGIGQGVDRDGMTEDDYLFEYIDELRRMDREAEDWL